MKFSFLLALMTFTMVASAADCTENPGLETLVDEISKAGKIAYQCDSRDLISGQYSTGALTQVYVDKEKGTAEVTYLGSMPGAKEDVASVLKKEARFNPESPRYELVGERTTDIFSINRDGSGILSQRYITWDGEERAASYACSVSKN